MILMNKIAMKKNVDQIDMSTVLEKKNVHEEKTLISMKFVFERIQKTNC